MPNLARVKNEIAPHDEDPAFVPADELDQLAALMLPPEVCQQPAKLTQAEAEALFEEGLRGAAGRSLLARDVAASRGHVRFYQALLDVEVDRLARGDGDVKRARFYSDLVDRQHRRLTTTCELLLRLDAVPAASFRVEAEQAAFLISPEAKERKS